MDVASVWLVSRFVGLPFRLRNPFVLMWVFATPIFLLRLLVGPSVLIAGGLSDPFFLKAIWIETVTVGVSTLYSVILILICQRSILSLLPTVEDGTTFCRRSRLQFLGAAFFGLGFISVAVMASREFGIVNWLLNPRSGYQFHRDSQGHWFALAVNCLAVGAALVGLFSSSRRQFFLMSLPAFFLAYLLGSKGLFLNTAIFFALAMNFRRMREASVVQPLLIIAAAVGMLANYAQAGASINFHSVAKYFDYFPNAARAIALFDSGALSRFDGTIFTTNFWSAVPRALFPEKPYVYGVLHLNEIMWPGMAKHGHTPAFSMGIDSYADFGWYGVLLAPFFSLYWPSYCIIVVLAADLYRKYPRHTPTIPGVLGFMMAFAPGFMAYLVVPWSIIWLACLAITLIGIRPVRSMTAARIR